ncbi:MAG: YesL family protein [Clostridiaceae bacterium]|nr:YesL family protein [Clostridiaceae bacterium]
MNNFFSIDGGLYKFMSRLLDMLKLNVLWLLCSLPIVTMGAATTAAYSITLKMVDEREGYVARTFFKEFAANFKQGTALGIIQLVAAYAIYLDFQLYEYALKYNTVFLIIGVIAILMTFLHTVYAFPLIARYENTLLKSMRNSYMIMIRYFPNTIFMVIILVVEMIVIFWNYTTVFLGILIGPACIMLTISGFALRAFRKVEYQSEGEHAVSGDEESEGEK